MKKGLNIALSVIAKITEIFHWIAAGIGGLLLIISAVDKKFFPEAIAEDGGAEFASYGFEVSALTPNGEFNGYATTMFCIGIMLSCILMALVFRNLNIILRTITGKYKHAESTSPFQLDVVRRVREMGIFAIAIPVVSLILSIIFTTISNLNGLELESFISFDGIIIGLICLCLTQIFSYGTKLEEDVEGLV